MLVTSVNKEQIENLDIEKEVLGVFFMDNTYECLEKTMLRPKHFLNSDNRTVFGVINNYYTKHHNLDVKDMITAFPQYADIIYECFEYGANYIVGTYNFHNNEERMIKRWQKEATKVLSERLYNEEISYNEYKIMCEEINENKYFKNLLEVTTDIEGFHQDKVKEREYTNINQLDYLLKGLEYGTISLWSAITNGGKTTLMTQLCKVNLRAGKKVFYFNGEQTGDEFKNNLYVSMCDSTQIERIVDKHNKNIVDVVPKKEMARYLDSIMKDKLYVYNNEIPRNDIVTMISVMNEAYKKGVRIFFIDNFMQLDNSEQLEQQTTIVEKFKRFARDKNVIVNIVAHPRKMNFNATRLTVQDISGSQNISNKSSNICTINRLDTMSDAEKENVRKYALNCGYNIEECDAFIEVLKTKGNANGIVGLRYNKELKTYTEVKRMDQEDINKAQEHYKEKKSKPTA